MSVRSTCRYVYGTARHPSLGHRGTRPCAGCGDASRLKPLARSWDLRREPLEAARQHTETENDIGRGLSVPGQPKRKTLRGLSDWTSIWRPRREETPCFTNVRSRAELCRRRKRPPFRTWTSLRAEGPAPALSRPLRVPTPSFFFLGSIRREETRTNKIWPDLSKTFVSGVGGNGKV